MPIKFIQIEPVAKPRMTNRDRWVQRPAVVRYRQYCDRLRKFDLSGIDWEDLHITFYLQMPKSWSAKKMNALDGAPHRQKPDIDNLLKGFMDALLENDAHIHTCTVSKKWCCDSPGIEVKMNN